MKVLESLTKDGVRGKFCEIRSRCLAYTLIPLTCFNLFSYMGANECLRNGDTMESFERYVVSTYEEDLGWFGSVCTFVTKPGRELAYLTYNSRHKKS